MAPTYRYKREDDTTFEIKESIKSTPLETCPETGQKVKRILFGSEVIYRGDGWPTKKFAKHNNYRKQLAKDPLYTSIGDKRDKLTESAERQREAIKKMEMDK